MTLDDIFGAFIILISIFVILYYKFLYLKRTNRDDQFKIEFRKINLNNLFNS